MPKGKKAVHDLLSPKIAEKRKRRREIALKKIQDAIAKKEDVDGPEEVDNFKVNKPLFGPHKIKKKKNPPVSQRKIAPNEGKPTVNAKSGKDVRPFIHKPGVVKPEMDPATGAIDKTKDSRKTTKKRN